MSLDIQGVGMSVFRIHNGFICHSRSPSPWKEWEDLNHSGSEAESTGGKE